MTDSFGVILHTPRKLLQDAKQNFFSHSFKLHIHDDAREECIARHKCLQMECDKIFSE